MDDRLAHLEGTLEQLSSAIRGLEQRVGFLEAQGHSASADHRIATESGATAAAQHPAATTVARDPHDPIAVLSLVGRLFLVLAGGFFLRAMTEAGLLPPQVGITLAFAYGLSWLVLADRASHRGEAVSAVFHAVGSAMIVFPLLVEATTRFEVLSAASSVAGLVLLTAGLLSLAWRRHLSGVAWVTVIAAPLTAAVLLLKTGLILPFALFLVALGASSLWLGLARGWLVIRWPAALAANLAVFAVTLRALMPEHGDAAAAATILQWALLVAYVGGIAIHSLARCRAIGWFEMTQTAIVLLLSVGSMTLVAWSSVAPPAAAGVVSLAFGALCYGCVFVVVDRRVDPGWHVQYYTTLALVLVFAGLALLPGARWTGLGLAALGVLAVGSWGRLGRPFLLLHGVAYAIAAGILSGAIGYSAWALFASADLTPWALPGWPLVAVGVAGAATVALAAMRPAPEGGAVATGLRLALDAACAWTLAGCVTGWFAALVIDEARIDLGALATVRTGVLAVGVLLVAWIGRHVRFREWAWLVYPTLVLIGIKMVAQDFRHSRPATLFVALALFGLALIIAPRLRKRAGAKADEHIPQDLVRPRPVRDDGRVAQ